jgi:hypothetical protein
MLSFFVPFAPPLAVPFKVPPPPAAIAAVAAGDVGGGDGLPGAGNWPPVDSLPGALFAAGLRVGLEPALLSADAKSWPPALRAVESADAVPLVDAGSMLMGACETVGIAFIPGELASDVPSARAARHFGLC